MKLRRESAGHLIIAFLDACIVIIFRGLDTRLEIVGVIGIVVQ